MLVLLAKRARKYSVKILEIYVVDSLVRKIGILCSSAAVVNSSGTGKDREIKKHGVALVHILLKTCILISWSKRAAYEIRMQDRKSTRLNSSHVSISYAVFCLKKKIK